MQQSEQPASLPRTCALVTCLESCEQRTHFDWSLEYLASAHSSGRAHINISENVKPVCFSPQCLMRPKTHQKLGTQKALCWANGLKWLNSWECYILQQERVCDFLMVGYQVSRLLLWNTDLFQYLFIKVWINGIPYSTTLWAITYRKKFTFLR